MCFGCKATQSSKYLFIKFILKHIISIEWSHLQNSYIHTDNHMMAWLQKTQSASQVFSGLFILHSLGLEEKEGTRIHSQTICAVNIVLFSCYSIAEWGNLASSVYTHFKIENCRAFYISHFSEHFYIINLNKQVTKLTNVLNERWLQTDWDHISDSKAFLKWY